MVTHYENTPMLYRPTDFSQVVKLKNCIIFFIIFIFLIFAQNMACRYTLEPPRRVDSNEYPQSMFWSKNKAIRNTHANAPFCYIKVRVYMSRKCVHDVKRIPPMRMLGFMILS